MEVLRRELLGRRRAIIGGAIDRRRENIESGLNSKYMENMRFSRLLGKEDTWQGGGSHKLQIPFNAQWRPS